MDGKEGLRMLYGVNRIARSGICDYGLLCIDSPYAVAFLLIGDIGRRAELYLLGVLCICGSIVVRVINGRYVDEPGSRWKERILSAPLVEQSSGIHRVRWRGTESTEIPVHPYQAVLVGLGRDFIIRNPDVPAPEDGAVSSAHCDNGIAGGLACGEINILAVIHRLAVDDVCASGLVAVRDSLPDELGKSGILDFKPLGSNVFGVAVTCSVSFHLGRETVGSLRMGDVAVRRNSVFYKVFRFIRLHNADVAAVSIALVTANHGNHTIAVRAGGILFRTDGHGTGIQVRIEAHPCIVTVQMPLRIRRYRNGLRPAVHRKNHLRRRNLDLAHMNLGLQFILRLIVLRATGKGQCQCRRRHHIESFHKDIVIYFHNHHQSSCLFPVSRNILVIRESGTVIEAFRSGDTVIETAEIIELLALVKVNLVSVIHRIRRFSRQAGTACESIIEFGCLQSLVEQCCWNRLERCTCDEALLECGGCRCRRHGIEQAFRNFLER